MRDMKDSLKGRVALVAGGTRGAGRGIAVQLGAAGATVYVTGRTTRAQRSEQNRPETIEDTAEQVTAAGGIGIAVQTDHLVPEQVKALVERIDREQGRLDVLVNDIWGGEHIFEWNNSFHSPIGPIGPVTHDSYCAFAAEREDDGPAGTSSVPCLSRLCERAVRRVALLLSVSRTADRFPAT